MNRLLVGSLQNKIKFKGSTVKPAGTNKPDINDNLAKKNKNIAFKGTPNTNLKALVDFSKNSLALTKTTLRSSCSMAKSLLITGDFFKDVRKKWRELTCVIAPITIGLYFWASHLIFNSFKSRLYNLAEELKDVHTVDFRSRDSDEARLKSICDQVSKYNKNFDSVNTGSLQHFLDWSISGSKRNGARVAYVAGDCLLKLSQKTKSKKSEECYLDNFLELYERQNKNYWLAKIKGFDRFFDWLLPQKAEEPILEGKYLYDTKYTPKFDKTYAAKEPHQYARFKNNLALGYYLRSKINKQNYNLKAAKEYLEESKTIFEANNIDKHPVEQTIINNNLLATELSLLINSSSLNQNKYKNYIELKKLNKLSDVAKGEFKKIISFIKSSNLAIASKKEFSKLNSFYTETNNYYKNPKYKNNYDSKSFPNGVKLDKENEIKFKDYKKKNGDFTCDLRHYLKYPRKYADEPYFIKIIEYTFKPNWATVDVLIAENTFSSFLKNFNSTIEKNKSRKEILKEARDSIKNITQDDDITNYPPIYANHRYDQAALYYRLASIIDNEHKEKDLNDGIEALEKSSEFFKSQKNINNINSTSTTMINYDYNPYDMDLAKNYYLQGVLNLKLFELTKDEKYLKSAIESFNQKIEGGEKTKIIDYYKGTYPIIFKNYDNYLKKFKKYDKYIFNQDNHDDSKNNTKQFNTLSTTKMDENKRNEIAKDFLELLEKEVVMPNLDVFNLRTVVWPFDTELRLNKWVRKAKRMVE